MVGFLASYWRAIWLSVWGIGAVITVVLVLRSEIRGFRKRVEQYNAMGQYNARGKSGQTVRIDPRYSDWIPVAWCKAIGWGIIWPLTVVGTAIMVAVICVLYPFGWVLKKASGVSYGDDQ